MKIIEFKNRKTKFKEWLKEVEKANFDGQEIDNCVILWGTKKETNYAKFNCDMCTLRWLHKMLGFVIRRLEMDEFLREHIQDYIQYIK